MSKNLYYLFNCLSLLFLFSFSQFSIAQSGIQLNTESAQPGYVLFETNFNGTFLVDNCGNVVNDWSVGNSNNHSKLLPNGNLLYQNNSTVFERSWDNVTLNQVSIPFGSLELEYEVIKLPNNNYLCVGRRFFNTNDFTNLGFETGGINNPTRIDVVVELDVNTGEIVWEWNIKDHVIQERDPSQNNYGVIADHPELLDMDALSTYDWTFTESFMINGMDYNPELDQIALSIRKMSEIIIIDHSTTTAEAAGHSGGNSGKGGDILYRWGNPQNYGQGDDNDRWLFLQHNPKWITHGPNAGKMTCYNNGLDRPSGLYSEVPILTLPVDDQGNYDLSPGSAFLPEAPDFVYGPSSGTDFFSEYTSGAELLPNGNMFITEGLQGRLLEVNPAGETVWQYTVPQAYYIFRTEKYPTNYPAFSGLALPPAGPAPTTNSTYDCEIFVSGVNDFEDANGTFSIRYQTNRDLVIENLNGNPFNYVLYDLNGNLRSKKWAVVFF